MQSLLWAKDDEIRTAVAHAETLRDKQNQVQIQGFRREHARSLRLYTNQNARCPQAVVQRLHQQLEKLSTFENMGQPTLEPTEQHRVQEQQNSIDQRVRWQEAVVGRLQEQLDRFSAFERQGISKQMLAEKQRLVQQLHAQQQRLEEQQQLKEQTDVMAALQEQNSGGVDPNRVFSGALML